MASGGLGELVESLILCVEDLHRVCYCFFHNMVIVSLICLQICTIVEPSSLFLKSTLPYLPVLFDLWRVTNTNNPSLRYMYTCRFRFPSRVILKVIYSLPVFIAHSVGK